MAITAYNTQADQKIERKFLITAVNVGTTAAPEWEVVGRGIDDSSIEYNLEVNAAKDILGYNETDVDSAAPTQKFEKYKLRSDSKLCTKLDDIMQRNALSELSLFEVLIVRGYVGEAGSYNAEKHTSCTITPETLGGSSYITTDITIYFSNNKTIGTADKLEKGLEFTASVA